MSKWWNCFNFGVDYPSIPVWIHDGIMLTKYYSELLKMISRSQISIVLHTFCVIFKCDKPSLSFHSSCSMSTPASLFWVPLQSCWCDYRGWWLRLHNSIKLIYCPQHGGRRKSLSPLFFPSRCSAASCVKHFPSEAPPPYKHTYSPPSPTVH